MARFPNANVIEVDSHWRIPALAGADPVEWVQTKREVLVLGIKSSLRHRDNGRSADFIAASISNGCLSSCQYCYVARQKGGSNPLTIFVNVEQIADSVERHSRRLGPKVESPDAVMQTDPALWTYDIGCNADLSVDALVCDHPGYLVERFARMSLAKATFATKTVYDDYWLAHEPRAADGTTHTRIRYSIMPQAVARYVDIGTSPISERIASVNRLVAGGYEVHLNFSPIIIYGNPETDEHGADQWRYDWVDVWRELDDTLSAEAKAQLKCELFFLTHSAELHEINVQWNARGEDFLWSPASQQPKRGKPDVLVYNYAMKRQELKRFEAGLAKYLPYCEVRYSF